MAEKKGKLGKIKLVTKLMLKKPANAMAGRGAGKKAVRHD
jgi:hypothetical protein